VGVRDSRGRQDIRKTRVHDENAPRSPYTTQHEAFFTRVLRMSCCLEHSLALCEQHYNLPPYWDDVTGSQGSWSTRLQPYYPFWEFRGSSDFAFCPIEGSAPHWPEGGFPVAPGGGGGAAPPRGASYHFRHIIIILIGSLGWLRFAYVLRCRYGY
jgi:hypothetical protein